MASQIPSMTQLQTYSVNRSGEAEGVRQTLYDFQTYAAAGQTSLSFFQTPVGQSGKTYADTNMTSAGLLPNPQKFLIQSIEIFFFPGVLNVQAEKTALPLPPSQFINDVAAVNQSGWLELNIGSKNYLREAPLGVFPPKTHLLATGAIAESIGSGASGSSMNMISSASFGGRPYFTEPPLLLEPTQNFIVTLNWASSVALPSNVAARIGVKLDGYLYRLSQ